METVLFVTRNFPPGCGGIETMSRELIRRADVSRRCLVLVHCGPQRCAQIPGTVFRYHYFWAKGKLSTYGFSLWMVFWFALRYRPVKIISSQIATAPGCWLSKILLRIPYCVAALGLELLPSPYGIVESTRRQLLNASEGVVSISRYTDSLVARLGVPPAKRKTILLGADPEKWHPVPWTGVAGVPEVPENAGADKSSGAFTLLTVGRLVPRKGIDTVMEACGRLLQKGKPVHYWVVGDGPDLPRLRELAASRLRGADEALANETAEFDEKVEFDESVFFLGARSTEELRQLFTRADLLVMPSRESRNPPEVEGFGLVYLEAAACGTPSIGSTSGGIPDAILDGETGWLVPPDNPEVLATQLAELMEHPELVREAGERARERVLRSLNWKTVSAAYWREFLASSIRS